MKKKKGEKIRQVKPAGTGLEGFVDWVNLTLPTRETQGDYPTPYIPSELVEESEHDMSNLATVFTA